LLEAQGPPQPGVELEGIGAVQPVEKRAQEQGDLWRSAIRSGLEGRTSICPALTGCIRPLRPHRGRRRAFRERSSALPDRGDWEAREHLGRHQLGATRGGMRSRRADGPTHAPAIPVRHRVNAVHPTPTRPEQRQRRGKSASALGNPFSLAPSVERWKGVTGPCEHRSPPNTGGNALAAFRWREGDPCGHSKNFPRFLRRSCTHTPRLSSTQRVPKTLCLSAPNSYEVTEEIPGINITGSGWRRDVSSGGHGRGDPVVTLIRSCE
jgi:hypothetical protein